MGFIGTVLLAAVATFRLGIVLSGNSFLSLTRTSDTAAVLNIGVLVFREGLALFSKPIRDFVEKVTALADSAADPSAYATQLLARLWRPISG